LELHEFSNAQSVDKVIPRAVAAALEAAQELGNFIFCPPSDRVPELAPGKFTKSWQIAA